MDKDSKGQRKIEDSGGGLLPAVERHSLEQNRNTDNPINRVVAAYQRSRRP